jgi:hypothetical protein
MEAIMNMNTPLEQLTVGEFLELLRQNIRPVEPEVEVKPDTDDRYVYGIGGIARLLGCSKTQVHEYRLNKWIEPAIMQHGRKIICDRKLAIELFGKRKHKKR